MSSILALSLLGCVDAHAPRRPAFGHDHPVYGGRLLYADADDIRSLDPAIGFDEVSGIAERLLFDQLIEYGPGTELVPGLADAWEVSADGLTWTFHLHPGVRFHGGREMVANDVVYSWERLFDPALASPGADFYGVVEGSDAMLAGTAEHASGLSAPDDHTFVVRLTEPFAAFPYVVAMNFGSVVPKEAVDERGDGFGFDPVGTGPFRLAEWEIGERTRFVRNPDYFVPGIPYLDEVDHLAHYGESLQFLKLEADELHQINRITAPDYLWVVANPAWKPYVDAIPQVDTYAELMNVEMPPFDDVWFRRAVSSAIDRDKIVRLLNGRAVATASWLPLQLAGTTEDIPYQHHDLAVARECMAKAGYPDGYPDVIPYVTTTTANAGVTALSIQQDLAAIGVRVEIRNMTFATYLSMAGRRKTMAFGYTAWIQDYPDPGDFLEPKFRCENISEENSNNDSFWCSADVDEKLSRARAELDPERRAALYRDIQREIFADAPYAIEYHSVQIDMRQPYVKGTIPHPVYIRDFTRAWFDLPDGRERP